VASGLAHRVDRILYWVIVIQVGAMAFIVNLQVFNRYVVNYVFGWEEETARYLMIWSSFLAAAYAYREGEQLGMEFVIRLFSRRLQRAIRMGTHIVTLVFLGVVAYQGFVVMLPQQLDQWSPSLGITMAIPYAAIPVCCVMMGGVALAFLLQEVRGKRPAEQGEGAPLPL